MAVFKQEKTKDGRCWFFMIRYTDLLGNRKQKKSQKFLTKKEAQDAERAFLIKLEKGETISDMTFKELYDAFFEFKQKKVKKTTLRTYIYRYPYFEMLFNIKVQDFSISHFELWKEKMYEFDLTNATRNDIFKLLKAMFNFGETYYNINTSAFYKKMTGFTDPNEIKKEMKYFTYSQFQEFLEQENDFKFKCIFEVLYYCGLRRGELRGLTWDNINFERKTLSVNKQVVTVGMKNTPDVVTSPKTKSSIRTIPMPDVLVNDLIELKKQAKKCYGFNLSFYVFGDVYPIGADCIRRHKDINCERAGLEKIRLHDFRHSCASLLINSGANINLVAHYLGHTKIEETLNTYSHLFDSALSNVTSIINNLVTNS